MSPYPVQVTAESIVAQACLMIEAEGGAETLSLHKLAAALGIKAPSLYRYFPSKTALLQAVNTATTHDLFSALQTAIAEGSDAKEQTLKMMWAYRAFAHANPMCYGLLYTNTLGDLRPDANETEQQALPLQALVAQIVGQERSLAALRGIWALLHGFIMLELTGQFQREGDLNAAFEQSITAFLNGWL